MATIRSPRRILILALAGALLAALMVLGLRIAAEPMIGGGQPDSLAARWVKYRVYSSIPAEEDRHFARLTPENSNGWFAISAETAQTFATYRHQNPLRPTTKRRTLVLQPIGAMNESQRKLLSDLREYCEAFFQLPTRIAPPMPQKLVQMYSRPQAMRRRDSSGGERQYHAGKIIDKVLAPRLPSDAAAYLGITMSDLYQTNMSFVFGVGSWDQRAGVYSLARYFPSFWGRKPQPDDEKTVLRRSCLILSHETGHLFGITHCVFYKCAMNGANSLVDADATPLAFCPLCNANWNGVWAAIRPSGPKISVLSIGSTD